MLHDESMSKQRLEGDFKFIKEKKYETIMKFYSHLNCDGLLDKNAIDAITCYILSEPNCGRLKKNTSKILERMHEYYEEITKS